MSLLFHHGIPGNKRPLDSHALAPLAPEVIAQAVDLPLPPPPAVIEANHINVESTPSTGTKSIQGKAPKWLKFAQSRCDMASHASSQCG